MAVQSAIPLPRYRSHKEVQALKIKAIDAGMDQFQDSYIITPEEVGCAPFEVSHEYCRKHKPEPGGYWVRYADGYESFSPAAAFEEGYTKVS